MLNAQQDKPTDTKRALEGKTSDKIRSIDQVIHASRNHPLTDDDELRFKKARCWIKYHAKDAIEGSGGSPTTCGVALNLFKFYRLNIDKVKTLMSYYNTIKCDPLWEDDDEDSSNQDIASCIKWAFNRFEGEENG